jgi:hypothetical protein
VTPPRRAVGAAGDRGWGWAGLDLRWPQSFEPHLSKGMREYGLALGTCAPRADESGLRVQSRRPENVTWTALHVPTPCPFLSPLAPPSPDAIDDDYEKRMIENEGSSSSLQKACAQAKQKWEQTVKYAVTMKVGTDGAAAGCGCGSVRLRLRLRLRLGAAAAAAAAAGSSCMGLRPGPSRQCSAG